MNRLFVFDSLGFERCCRNFSVLEVSMGCQSFVSFYEDFHLM